MKTIVSIRRNVHLQDQDPGDVTCSMELELAQDVLQVDPDAMHRQLRAAIAVCRKAIHGEMTPGRVEQVGVPSVVHQSAAADSPSRNSEQTNGARASDKQLVYLRQLARLVPAVGLRRLDEVAQNVCGKTTVVLSTAEASRLIDSLKAVKAGELDLEQILPGAPA